MNRYYNNNRSQAQKSSAKETFCDNNKFLMDYIKDLKKRYKNMSDEDLAYALEEMFV